MFFIHVLFSVLGLGCNLPLNAYLTAHRYYQVRTLDTQTTQDTIPWSHEALFVILFTICNFGGLVSLIALPRCSARSPLLCFLLLLTVLLISTMFTTVPALLPYKQIMLVFAMISIVGLTTAHLQGALYRLAAKFGHNYIPSLSSGQAFAGLFAALLRLMVMSSMRVGSQYCDTIYFMLCCLVMFLCIICYGVMYCNGAFRLRINLDRVVAMAGSGIFEDGINNNMNINNSNDNMGMHSPLLQLGATRHTMQNALIVEYLDFLSTTLVLEEEPHILLGGVYHLGPQNNLQPADAVMEQLLLPSTVNNGSGQPHHNINLSLIPSLPGSTGGFENPTPPASNPEEEILTQPRPISLSEFSDTSAHDYRIKHHVSPSRASSSMKREEASFQYLVNQEGEPLITSNKLLHDDIYGRGRRSQDSVDFQPQTVEFNATINTKTGDQEDNDEQPSSPLYYFKKFDVQETNNETQNQFISINSNAPNQIIPINQIHTPPTNNQFQPFQSMMQQQQHVQLTPTQNYHPNQNQILQENLNMHTQYYPASRNLQIVEVCKLMSGYIFVIFLTYVVTFAAFPSITSSICSVHNTSTYPPCQARVKGQSRIFGDLFAPLGFALFHAGDLMGRWFSKNVGGYGAAAPKCRNLVLYGFLRVFLVVGLLMSKIVTAPMWTLLFQWPVDAVPWMLFVMLGFTMGHLGSIGVTHVLGKVPDGSRKNGGYIVAIVITLGILVGSGTSYILLIAFT